MPKVEKKKQSHENNGKASGADSPLPGNKKPRGSASGKNRISKSKPLDLKKCKDLIGQIQKDIAALGVVGEADNCLLIYLTGTSRLRKHPLRLIIRGNSSAGKSYSLAKVVSLFPTSEIVEATSLSKEALYYGSPGWLEHKFFIKGERSHSKDEDVADVTAALRQLISEDRITKQVTGPEKETLTIEQDGPIAYCETTTRKTVFPEDLNRCLQIFADESESQTKKILSVVARQYDGRQEPDQQGIIDRHHEFQRSLKDVDVVIPFAGKLANHIPTVKLESRRAFKQLLATVETIAFVQQHHRKRDAKGRLVATAQDYSIARRLLLAPLNESIGIGARAWSAYHALQAKFPEQNFTSSQTLKSKVFNNRMTRDRAFKDLEKMGVIECLQKAKGSKPAQWGWTGKALKPVLPETVV